MTLFNKLWGKENYFPQTNKRGNFNTNAESYYKYLERVNEILKIMAKMVDEQNEKLDDGLQEIRDTLQDYINQLNSIINEGLDDVVIDKMVEWLHDGTLENIINHEIFQNKLDTVIFEQFEISVNQRLKHFSDLRTYDFVGKIDFDKFQGLTNRIDFDVFSHGNGMYTHTFKKNEENYTNFYLSKTGENSTHDGLSPETAWRSLFHAIDRIEADTSVTHAKINFEGYIDRDVIPLNRLLTKKYIFDLKGKTIGSKQSAGSWTHHSGNVFTSPMTYDIKEVFSQMFRNSYGKSRKLIKVTTLSQCQSNSFSWFSNGTDIFINLDGIVVTDENTFLDVGTNGWKFDLAPTAEIMVKNGEFINGGSTQPMYFNCTNGVGGRVIIEKLTLQNTNFSEGSIMNGIMTMNILDTKLFEVNVFNIPRDAFNYHTNIAGTERGTVFEFNCYAENVGVGATVINNNISSAHDGIHIIRVGTKGNKGYGPLIADVNGCYSLNIGVVVNDTQWISDSYRNAGFSFNDEPALNWDTPNGRYWLIDCAGGTENEWAINVDPSINSVDKLFLRNFKGKNIPNELQYTIID